MGIRDDVEAVVHSIDQIYVGVTAAHEHHVGARGSSFRSMTREVVRTDVGLRFDDASRTIRTAIVVQQHEPEQIARYGSCISRVERPWQSIAHASRSPGLLSR